MKKSDSLAIDSFYLCLLNHLLINTINMKLKNLLSTLLLILLNYTFISAQTVFYNEDFAGETDKGVIGPATYTYDTTGVTWVIDASATTLTASTDYFKVNASEQFEAKDVDEEAIWYSESVDISSVTFVNLSVDIAETGTLSGADYIKVYYVLDGGTETLFETNGDNVGEFTSANATHNYLSGSTVQIVIRIDNSAGTKTHLFDNITVTESTSNPPTAGDVLITEYARNSTSNRSYLELYNTTSTDIHLVGSKIVSSGFNDIVLDFDSDIPGTNIVPANGFLILNRDASQANFESTWGVDLSTQNATVTYNRTGQSTFGNNNLFMLRTGGTVGVDDGTKIDSCTENATSLGKRVFQLPLGYWSGNEVDAATYATPGYFYEYETIDQIDMVFSDGSWHNADGYTYTEPSSSTGAGSAVILRGNGTLANGTLLSRLAIWPDAGTSLSTETVSISTGLYVANNGSLAITSTGSVTCSGEIIIERNGHNTTNDYNAWGSPFSTGLRVDSVFTEQNNCDFYVLKASEQSWKHDYTVGETIDCAGFSYTVSTANVISSPEGTPDGMFDVARGYFIVGNTNNEYDFKITSGATLNNGDITANIYGSSGTASSGSNDWNLLSNPYPSAISIDDFLTTNSGNITNAVYLYNPNTGRDVSTSYNTYNSTDAAYIASCQGFYVDASTTTDGFITTLSFDNSMRSNSNDGFRSALSFFGVYLKVEDTAHVSDQTRLYFDIDALDELDSKFDAQKLENTKFNFCSKLNDNKLVFNGMPSLTTDTKVIPLYFQTAETSIYTISLDSLIGSFSNKEILLEDRLMRKFYDLKTQSYSFSSQPKEWANRFFVHIIHKKDDSNSGNNGGSIGGTSTSIDEVENSEIVVFNERDEIIVTSLNENILINEIQLLSITGQVYYKGKVNDTNFRLDVSTLSNGVYLVNYTLENGITETKKVMIQ